MTDPAVPSSRPLHGDQAIASDPGESDVWLSASAGTGKTHVLSARVLRLLLHGTRPEAILCLTFTKAGAAEMSNRVAETLARWVRMKDAELGRQLLDLGEDCSPGSIAAARSLFASVLDAPGGGLRVQTIHSFCQSLLAGFPAEAGLTPGFRLVEGREEEALAQSALADMAASAERGGDAGLIARIQRLSHRMGEDGARAFLRRCATAPEALAMLAPGVEARVRRWLGIGDIAVADVVREGCSDGALDRAGLERLAAMNEAWGTKTGIERAATVRDWLLLDPAHRAEQLGTLALVWTKQNGERRIDSTPKDAEYPELAGRFFDWSSQLVALEQRALLAAGIADALTVGQRYAESYVAAKRAAGVVDFGDLVTRTVSLLRNPEMGAWIGWKLDQRTDHILVDEAQDTNAAQWDIVKVLAEEFYAGEGARGHQLRTLFTVGDFKQAIFGFQGTDPNEFAAARRHFTELARQAERTPLDLSLNLSFRSSQPILDVVDAVIEEVTPQAMGIEGTVPRHLSAGGGPGSVTLWAPVTGAAAPDEDAEMGWVDEAERIFARTLAHQVRHWTQGGLMLGKKGRSVEPGDVLILVRSRGERARLIVSLLHEAGVEVAGVDRLRLNAPLAVQDVMSCLRFVLQPEDDLNLAALLVSPLVGWSQDELYARSRARRGTLWAHLGDAKPEALRDLLSLADFTTPHRFIETILSGPIEGRRKLLRRLGPEARDPVEELVNAALAFERDQVMSLQSFVDWFDRGDVEIARDPSQPGNAVRVMTVHGAKGLQAPVVVLADATANPDYRLSKSLQWRPEKGLSLPLFRPRTAELALAPSLAASAAEEDLRERQEHWRLLYVALTRAEEHLFIGGAAKPKQQKNGLGDDSWHVRIDRALAAMGVAEGADGARCLVTQDRLGSAAAKTPRSARSAAAQVPALPVWAMQRAPEEARPPRPLAPSAIRPEDDVADPPASPARTAAAERGILLHRLFERLPALPPEQRRASGDRWLMHSAGMAEAAEREALLDGVIGLIEDPSFSEVFGPDALAEVPIAGVVGAQVIAGTVDRLLVSAGRIIVIDFKTGRRVPRDAGSVPPHHVAQMAAYAAVLQRIYPARPVSAGLLYTGGPSLLLLPQDVLDRYKPDRTG